CVPGGRATRGTQVFPAPPQLASPLHHPSLETALAGKNAKPQAAKSVFSRLMLVCFLARKSLELMGHRQRPAAQGVSRFPVNDRPARLDLAESRQQLRTAHVHNEERAAEECFRGVARVGLPQVVLALAV